MEEVTVKARKAIDTLWKECLSHARGWGLKGKGNNIFEGSNIILIDRDEVIILAIDHPNKEQISIHEFKRSMNTKLGSKVMTLLSYHKVKQNWG